MQLVIGAGQIGRTLTQQLLAAGEEVTVLRRRDLPVPGARVIAADANDPAAVRRAAAGASAIHHAMHASAYVPDVWRRELPAAERNVMDIAAERGIPVVFPESVYAFGRAAEDLREGAPTGPCSPLGQIRAELLAARAEHPAAAISVVASDLVGATVSPGASVPTLTVIRPLLEGRTPWVLGDPTLPHAVTDVADLAAAMIHAAAQPGRYAGQVLHAPTAPARSLQRLADDVAAAGAVPQRRLRRVPALALRALGTVSPVTRSLGQMDYLWSRPCRLHPGELAAELPEPRWEDVVAAAIEGAREHDAA